MKFREMSVETEEHAIMQPLYTQFDPERHTTTAKIGGPDEDDADLALAYSEAARLIVASWREAAMDDALIVVALYNYRHALELGLKSVIRQMLRSLQYDLGSGSLPPAAQNVENHLGRTHAIALLSEDLRLLAGMFKIGLNEAELALLQSIHDIDPTGQALRYTEEKSRSGTHAARPTPVYVDVDQVVARMSDAVDGLDELHARFIDLQDWQSFVGPEHAPPPAPNTPEGVDPPR